MFIVTDNAKSVLGLKGTNGQEIYAMVEELGQLNNICLCITTRISTIPPDCEILAIPTLSAEAVHDVFYCICKNGGLSDLINNILHQLGFHPLSIALLVTIVHHSMQDTDWLAKEWGKHYTGVLQTGHNKSLAATINLSLSSPMFQDLGPHVHDLLGVIAFFPQGVGENNLNWLFPTISNRITILDRHCIISLAYRSNGIITMLAPLRNHPSPQSPMLSPLLCTAKDHCFHRLSVDFMPSKPGFEEALWITPQRM